MKINNRYETKGSHTDKIIIVQHDTITKDHKQDRLQYKPLEIISYIAQNELSGLKLPTPT